MFSVEVTCYVFVCVHEDNVFVQANRLIKCIMLD